MFLPPSARAKPIGAKKPLTKRQADKAIRPIAYELGKFNLAWNNLQDYLSLVFSTAINSEVPLAHAIWHSTPNDRAQREMLRAAAQVTFLDKTAFPPKAQDDILWLLDRTQTLADRRNDAVHSPFIFKFSGDGKFELVPQAFLGHPRASKLVGKDILQEFRWYRACAEKLSFFAYRLFYGLKHDKDRRQPWPQRPQMPQLGRSKTHKTKHLRTGAKSRPRPPESSGA